MRAPWRKSYDQPRQLIKKQGHYFAKKGPYSQSYDFSRSHVWMWELNYKESWVLKNWCFWIVVLEKTLESPLHSKEIQPLHPKQKQFWMFIGRTDAEAETPILWPPDAKNWSWKRPWCWDRLKVGEEDSRGWDGWMALSIQWTWLWVNSGSSWWTGRPGVLQSMGSQRVRHNWATELNWTELMYSLSFCSLFWGCSCCSFLFLTSFVLWIINRNSFRRLGYFNCGDCHNRLAPYNICQYALLATSP